MTSLLRSLSSLFTLSHSLRSVEMLDEAAEPFEKIEVRAPDMSIVHAFLGPT